MAVQVVIILLSLLSSFRLDYINISAPSSVPTSYCPLYLLSLPEYFTLTFIANLLGNDQL
jgi:hypothetical protein